MHGHRSAIAAGVFAAALLIAGCGKGDSGPAGAAGAPGPSGPPGPSGAPVAPAEDTSEATALEVTITDAVIASPPVVTFSATNQDGVGFRGLAPENVRFTLAKLVPPADGGPPSWKSYINRVERPASSAPGSGPDGKALLSEALQATTENGTAGTLTYLGGGTYRYTFATDITNVTSPEAVSYEPNLTHRVAIQVSGGDLPVANAWLDFVPAGGPVSTTRNIATVASCNQCHAKLALHGGSRTDVEYCVTCHNPGTTDANSGNVVDLKVLIHKLHRGESLPSVEAGSEYVIWGFRDSEHDYSDLAYPQDIRNCTKCHAASAATPDGDNWKLRPSRAACRSCHDDIVFDGEPEAWQTSHFSRETDDSRCVVCHEPGAPRPVEDVHRIATREAAENIHYAILGTTDTAPGEFPKVTYSVTDGDGNPIRSGQNGWTLSTGVLIGWDTRDYKHSTSTAVPALPGRPVGPISITSASTVFNDADGTYTATSPVAIPADVVGSGVAAVQGRATHASVSGNIPVRSVSEFFPITDTVAVPRREVVAIEMCQACHESLSLHGANRTDDIDTCVICHNANNTDIDRRRGATMEGGVAGIDGGVSTLDGKSEESIDFKTMIHGIHAGARDGHGFREAELVVYGFGNTPHEYGHVRFPGVLENCETCHVAGAYEVPLDPAVQGTTHDSDGEGSGNRADLDNHHKVTPTMAVCSSCHDSALAKSHMEQNGGDDGLTRSEVAAASETCAICHAPGRVADVKTMHGIE